MGNMIQMFPIVVEKVVLLVGAHYVENVHVIVHMVMNSRK